MAFYRLGTYEYKTLNYNQDVWDGNGGRLHYMLNDFYPELGVLTREQAAEVCWLYGMVYATGNGSVKICYPYSTGLEKKLLLKNIEMGHYPFVVLEAEGDNFIGWFAGDKKIQSGRSKRLEISLENDKFEKITEFEARFGT